MSEDTDMRAKPNSLHACLFYEEDEDYKYASSVPGLGHIKNCFGYVHVYTLYIQDRGNTGLLLVVGFCLYN